MGKKNIRFSENHIEHHGLVVDSKNGFDVINCEHCQFLHVVPVPTDQDLEKLYIEDFYSIEKPLYFKKAEEDLAWWQETYKNYYKIFEKYIKGKKKKILDIGSGPGYFLKCGKELGWDVLGVEPSKLAFDYSRKMGVDVVNSLFTASKMQSYGKFDVVYMDKVIEHLPNPVKAIKDIKKTLKPNGIFCIVGPNDYNPLQITLREKMKYEPWWVAPPQHINYFTFQSIKKLLLKLGFEVMEVSATFPMEFFLLAGENYVIEGETGRRCHEKRKMFEKNMRHHNADFLEKLYKFFAEKEIGREFIIIAKLKDN